MRILITLATATLASSLAGSLALAHNQRFIDKMCDVGEARANDTVICMLTLGMRLARSVPAKEQLLAAQKCPEGQITCEDWCYKYNQRNLQNCLDSGGRSCTGPDLMKRGGKKACVGDKSRSG